jgi:hypothetical protein
VLLALVGWTACGDGAKNGEPPAPGGDDAEVVGEADARVLPPPRDGARAEDAPVTPEAGAVDAPVDRGGGPADVRRDLSIDLPEGPQPMGASCEIPGGGMLPCAAGLLCCKPCCDGRPAVCTRPAQNAAGIGNGRCPLPDLTVDAAALRQSVGIGPMSFSTSSCEAREACIDGPGTRTALHFEVTTPNRGTSDLVLGSPLSGLTSLSSGFVFSRCHEHYHFSGYALYQLLDPVTGKEVLQGKKRAFCLEDVTTVDDYPLPRGQNAKYDCDYQGIQMGWADTYHNGLTCQFMDVTGVPPGRYDLRVTVNPDKIFPELSYDNNTAQVPVTIPGPPASPVESCVGQVPGLNRECGWRKLGSYPCTAGQRVEVGCGVECGLGRADGDPMIRVCPGDDACAWPGLGGNDDCTTSLDLRGAKVAALCPASGRITVMAGPAYTGDEASCDVAVR